jgi:hypothetical protein
MSEGAFMPAEPGSLISETERREARDAFFTEAKRRGQVVTVSAYQSPDELVFHFGERWVEGTNIHGQRVRIPLDQVRRFDLDYTTREGDDKTHYFFYLLLASAQDTLVYSERAPERDYNPLPEASRREQAETNLGALAALSRIEGRSTFNLADPENAFAWAPKPGPSSVEGNGSAVLTGLALLFLLIALYYVIVR